MERWLIFIQISPDLLSYTTWNSLSMATDRKRKYRANMYSDPDLAGTENDNHWLISTFFKSWENSRCNNFNHHLLRYCNFFRYRLKFGCSKYQKGVGGCHVHVGLWPPPPLPTHIHFPSNPLPRIFCLDPRMGWTVHAIFTLKSQKYVNFFLFWISSYIFLKLKTNLLQRIVKRYIM